MDTTIDVAIPVDEDIVDAFASPARRQAAGRYLSGLVREGRLRDILAEALAQTKQDTHARGLTDALVDADLEAWRAERHE